MLTAYSPLLDSPVPLGLLLGHLLVGAFFVCLYLGLMLLATVVGRWLSRILERSASADDHPDHRKLDHR
ncbi:MAG: hypothetical protein ACR2KG_02110 [Nocardioidaceae bacterium]